MKLVQLMQMQLAFLYEINEDAEKRAYTELDQFLASKGINPITAKHYFYYLNMSKKTKKQVVFILYAQVSEDINTHGKISTIRVEQGTYLTFALNQEELAALKEGDDIAFEAKIKMGLGEKKKTRMMNQVFALIEEVGNEENRSYCAYIPVE